MGIIMDTTLWILTRNMVIVLTKQYAKERYGEEVHVLFKKLNEEYYKEDGDTVAACGKGTMKISGKEVDVIVYDELYLSKLVIYPKLVNLVINHEVTHIKHKNHDQEFWEELRKHYHGYLTIPECAIEEYEFDKRNYGNAWKMCKRYDPFKYGKILGGIIYIVTLFRLIRTGELPHE